ncbi:MAG: hypothetical protein VX000_04560, partial [Myxococcota bacterium]|nr:hypothetical protein [Myxococcota bacterium]
TLVASAETGALVGRPESLGDGRWRLRYRAPDATGEARLLLRTGETTVVLPVPVEPWPLPSSRLARTHALTIGGADALLVPVEGATDAHRLQGPEGTTARVADGIAWRPGPDPFPRAIPLLLDDPDDPGVPAATVVMLRARPRLPVQTEPGTRVTVEIGRRSYGPVIAGDDGVAHARAEVRPGETTATLLLEDAAGNVQRSQLSLGGASRPAIAALAEARLPGQERSPRVHLFAVSAVGSPWTGAAPRCVTSLGTHARVVPVLPGRWTATVPRQPDDTAFAVRVDCTVAGVALATVRIPPPPPSPEALDIRVSPPELRADVPRAAVRVLVLDEDGDRLPSEDVQLEAELGSLEETQRGAAALRAVYAGDAAVAAGGDTLTARWTAPVGQGPIRGFRLGGEREGGASHARIHARALDAAGHPIAGAKVWVRIGDSQLEVRTDERGWATAAMPTPAGIATAEVEAAGRIRRITLPPASSVGAHPDTADLETSIRVAIRSGLVRRVFLSTDPGTLVLTGVERARVLVRLEDQEGNPVADPGLRLHSSEGVVTRPRRRADGTYEALWAPPPGMAYGRVRISAESEDGSFAATSTDLDVVPREARRAPGFAIGWLAGPRGVSSPFLRVSGDLLLPVARGRIYGRAWLGLYGERATATDVTGLDVTVDLTMVPVGIGAATRQERGRLAGWLGASFVLAPYRIEAQVDETVAARGIALANPGLEIGTGGGLRLRGGELTTDVGYLFLATSPDGIGWRGPVGGFMATLGYRLLF